jgi:hypothetical protein
VRRDFPGRGTVETFFGTRVEAMGEGVQLARRVARQVGTLGPVLAQHPLRVLVGAAWPRAGGIGQEDLDGEPVGHALVRSHLFPSIRGPWFAQQRGPVSECLGEALSGPRRLRPLQPCQDDQACGPLHPRPDGRPMAGPLAEVARPVARYGAGGPSAGHGAIDVLLGI